MPYQLTEDSTMQQEHQPDWQNRKVYLAISLVLDLIGIVCGLTAIFTGDASFTIACLVALIPAALIMVAVVIKDSCARKNRRAR